MAGNYPDAPGHRMLIDKDGTVGVCNTSQLTSGQMQNINKEADPGDVSTVNGQFVLIFPEHRDVVGYRIVGRGDIGYGIGTLEWSPNTTNGYDGTWSSVTTAGINAAGTYRDVTAVSLSGVRAFRWKPTASAGSTYIHLFHVYGTITAGENPNRLAIWHPTLDQLVGPAYFDWGDVPRSSSADRTFRIKNMSSTQTANSINVSLDALTDTTPSVPAQHTLSSDGVTFTGSVSAGTLAPGAISGVLTLRRVTPSNAVLSLWAARLNAAATSWS